MTFYANPNFPTKKALKEAVQQGRRIGVISAGLGTPKTDGEESVCGPSYPLPHSWYARVLVKGGIITKVKS